MYCICMHNICIHTVQYLANYKYSFKILRATSFKSNFGVGFQIQFQTD